MHMDISYNDGLSGRFDSGGVMKTDNKPTFTVLVDDNFHFMDEDERWTAGTYDSLREALERCLQMVGQDLLQGHRATMAAADLYESYTMMGDDPFIQGPMKTMFSAWNYAQELATFLAGRTEGAAPAAEEPFRAAWLADFLALEKSVPANKATRMLDVVLEFGEEEAE
jgi:hypothetical protein